jgi:hypothetical protein
MQETLQLLHVFDLTPSGSCIMPHAQLSISVVMTPKSFQYNQSQLSVLKGTLTMFSLYFLILFATRLHYLQDNK